MTAHPIVELSGGGKNVPMAKSRKPSIGWGNCKSVIRTWPQPGVVALVRELYDLSDENRQFLHARLLPQNADQTLAAAKAGLEKILNYNAAIRGRFSHREIKKLIDRYAKATDDPARLCDLLIVDMDEGFATMGQLGDYEEMVDHLYWAIGRLNEELVKVQREMLGPLVERLSDLANQWGRSFGYGISDEIKGMAMYWSEQLLTPEDSKGGSPAE
jgi:hypothetical protein